MRNKKVVLTSNEDSIKNISGDIDLSYFNQAVTEMQKIYSSIFNNESFKQLINESIKIDKVVKNVMETYQPILDQHKKQQKLIDAFMNPPEIITPRISDKRYSEEEVDEIVEKFIDRTFAMVNNSKKQDIKEVTSFPYKLERDFQWENIVIKFKDRHNVQIVADKYIAKVNYKDMGFEDSNTLKPNNQWLLLEELSNQEGEFCWAESLHVSKAQKTKQLLSKQLKKYFNLKIDPFETDRKNKIYKIKIVLVSESSSIDDVPVIEEDNLGLEDGYEEMTR